MKTYTAQEAADVLQIDRNSLYYLLRTGRLHGSRLGEGSRSKWRFTEDDIRAFLGPREPEDIVYTPKEVARLLKVSESKMYWMLEQRLIPACKVHKSWRILREDLLQYLQDNRLGID